MLNGAVRFCGFLTYPYIQSIVSLALTDSVGRYCSTGVFMVSR